MAEVPAKHNAHIIHFTLLLNLNLGTPSSCKILVNTGTPDPVERRPGSGDDEFISLALSFRSQNFFLLYCSRGSLRGLLC